MGEFLVFWATCVVGAVVVAALWGGVFLLFELAARALLLGRKGAE
jgi:hypothetical protein